MNILIIGVVPKSLINFRGELIEKIASKNHTITSLSSHYDKKVSAFLKENNGEARTYHVTQHGMSLKENVKTFFSLRKKIKKNSPDILLAYTIKPIIWGGLTITTLLKKPKFYVMIEGVGFVFQKAGYKRKFLKFILVFLYKRSLKNAQKVIFLNKDNKKEFINNGIVSEHQSELINGIGVNLKEYNYSPIPNKKTIFLSIARLLKDKGLREYAEAATIVKKDYPNITFQLLGREDSSSDGIPMEEVLQWQKKGIIDYLGSTEDVRPYLHHCHIYVLPSYHEGMPRTVLEAMAIGRPILTTDVPGCRDTVQSGENGYLIAKADAIALAERMVWFIKHRDQWQEMGYNSRQMAEEKFDVHKINTEIMSIMKIDGS
jgi:glycosyltransferase involved in cell wall biosynthesis